MLLLQASTQSVMRYLSTDAKAKAVQQLERYTTMLKNPAALWCSPPTAAQPWPSKISIASSQAVIWRSVSSCLSVLAAACMHWHFAGRLCGKMQSTGLALTSCVATQLYCAPDTTCNELLGNAGSEDKILQD